MPEPTPADHEREACGAEFHDDWICDLPKGHAGPHGGSDRHGHCRQCGGSGKVVPATGDPDVLVPCREPGCTAPKAAEPTPQDHERAQEVLRAWPRGVSYTDTVQRIAIATAEERERCAKAVCPECAAGNEAHRVEFFEGPVGIDPTKRVAYLHRPTHTAGLVQMETCKAEGIWRLGESAGA